jgi:hypothetical protein
LLVALFGPFFFGPFFFGALFQAHDTRARLEDATRMAPMSARQRLWGSALNISAVPLTIIGILGLGSLDVVAVGPLAFIAPMFGLQLVVFGLALVVSALTARTFGSKRPRASFLLITALAILAGAAGAESGCWLPRMVLGTDLFAFVEHTISFAPTQAVHLADVWWAFALSVTAQLSILMALLAAPSVRDSSGTRRTFGVVASPSAVARYRSALRASLGQADNAMSRVYALGVGVLVLFGVIGALTFDVPNATSLLPINLLSYW